MQDGRFREDLFYRLNVANVQSSTERREEIRLCDHFCESTTVNTTAVC
jgi:transcriptional regulator with PAS, ATPase and Fis domain